MTINDAQLNALCSLLEDDTPGVAAALERQIASFSPEEQGRLLDALRREGVRPAAFPEPLAAYHQLRIERGLAEWVASPAREDDLETPAFLLASSAYPLDDMSAWERCLDEMAEAVRARLPAEDDHEGRIRRFVDYLHGELGFEGDREHYYDPQNSYLNRVLDRRRGIPIALSVLYLLLGRRTGLPFQGVGMPGHFVVRYVGGEAPVYLDPFDKGCRLAVSDCAAIVRELGYHFDARFLEETPVPRIVERMVNNLIGIAQRAGQEAHARQLLRYREIIQGA